MNSIIMLLKKGLVPILAVAAIALPGVKSAPVMAQTGSNDVSGDFVQIKNLSSTFDTPAVENEYLKLYVNDMLNIAVFDKTQGVWHYSCPPDADDDSLSGTSKKEFIKSIVNIDYLDSDYEVKKVTSFKDCLNQPNVTEPLYSVSADKENCILRMDLTFGREEQRTLIPDAFIAERFHQFVDGMDEQNAAAMKRYYLLWSSDDDEVSQSIKNERLSQYPALEKYDIYVKKLTRTNEDKAIETALNSVGYTLDDKDEDQRLLGLTEKVKSTPYFKLPVEFSLDKDQFIATVKADEAVYNPDFPLLNISVLPFFGAGKTGENGYIFVPDGNGAIINFNNNKTKTDTVFSQKYYGTDQAADGAVFNTTAHNLTAPVFGIKRDDSSVFGIIEKGDAGASLYAELGNVDSVYNAAHAIFSYAFYDRFYFNESSHGQGGWIITDKNVHNDDFKIRFFFLYGEGDCGYTGMAKCYQNYLLDNNVLTEKYSADSSSLVLTLLGSCDGEGFFLIFPVQKKIPLTTFQDAAAIIDELRRSGINNIIVRYKGWANGGLNNKLFNTVKVQRELGGQKELKMLADYLEQNHIPFFPEIDPVGLYNTSGYSSYKNSSRKIDGRVAAIGIKSAASGLPESDLMYSLIKPSLLNRMFDGFSEKYDKLNIDSLSVSNAGKELYGDYQQESGTNIAQSKAAVESLLKSASDSYSLMIDYGNAHTIRYADYLYDFPVENSGYTVEDESIPFLSMVYHGYKGYAGFSLNVGQHIDEYFLKSVEAGADFQFSLAMRNFDKLKESGFSQYSSVDFSAWKDRVVEYTRKTEALDGLKGKRITGHEIIKSGVRKVTYENGTKVYVNYTRGDFQAPEGIVPARNYMISK